MGELRLPGLATGIDTASLIKQMMIINSRRLASYQVKKISYETQNTSLEELKTKVAALESAAGQLSDSSDLEIFSSTTSDNDMLKLSTSSQANTGSHWEICDLPIVHSDWASCSRSPVCPVSSSARAR